MGVHAGLFEILQSLNRLFRKKRRFTGPGGVVKGLDLEGQTKICARKLASVASRGLQGPPTTTTTLPPTTYHHQPLLPTTTHHQRYISYISGMVNKITY